MNTPVPKSQPAMSPKRRFLTALFGGEPDRVTVGNVVSIVTVDLMRTYTIGQLRSLWSMASITAKTMHCREGGSEWRPLSTILDQLEPTAPLSPAVTQPTIVLLNSTKSRGVYIVLGLFFGLLGIHNFYADHNRTGAWQLIITLTLGWAIIGLIVSGIWALSDVCTIKEDGVGRMMT